jgi:hypothetical protein
MVVDFSSPVCRQNEVIAAAYAVSGMSTEAGIYYILRCGRETWYPVLTRLNRGALH